VRQVVQDLRHGETYAVEVPRPAVRAHHVLIRTRAGLISAGTERMLVEFGKANLLQKARQQPDKVRQVIDKIRTDGLAPTLSAVRDKLSKPIPLGYCNAGVVLEVGRSVAGLKPGDPVASNGPHAEIVCVPENLCAAIPVDLLKRAADEQAGFESAAFTVLGAIALQAVRLASPTLGETFAVIGLGLVGQLTVQILRANGCRVLGIDLCQERVALAESFGARGVVSSESVDPVAVAVAETNGRGVDGVVIAAATSSSAPVHQAATMCRKRGRIVLVGVTGLDLKRDDFYEKELTFQVSCSYGPGRYDPQYERKGQDYPHGFVRWTAKRNFEAVLDLMASGTLDVAPLVTERIPLEQAGEVYGRLAGGSAGLGTILTYQGVESSDARTVRVCGSDARPAPPGEPVVGVIGAGSFATRTILPLLKASDVRRKAIASRGGMDAALAGRKYGFEQATTDVQQVLDDGDVNTVFILTPHDSHADLVCQALGRGKHVFVEKPLAVTREQLKRVKASYARASATSDGAPLLHVGFNRRFAPDVVTMKRLLDSMSEPRCMSMMVNAGRVAADHWVSDPEVGGGRIIGEACHFVDLLRFLAGSRMVGVQAAGVGDGEDGATITISFEDGSVGTVQYWANGSKAYPKERLEVFVGGRVLMLESFRRLRGYGWRRLPVRRLICRQDKGHADQVRLFLQRVRDGGEPPIPFGELVEVTEACFRAVEEL